VGSALLRGDVPVSWEKKWDGGPEVASAWLTTLVRKKRALTRWAAMSASQGASRLLASPLNLSDLFNPGTFLNAFRQQSARALRVPLEETRLVSAWETTTNSNSSSTKSKLSGIGCDLVVTCDGLVVENAEVDSKGGYCLAEVLPSAPETSRAPQLSLAFVPTNHPSDPYRGESTLLVPVYHSPTREKHLVDIAVPIGGGRGGGENAADITAKWVLSGVAFLLSGE
jgi:dynein heavy chain 2